MSPTSRPDARGKVYRLALYGRRASGKTCILAALAMARDAHPDGLSCDWLPQPPGVQRPAGDPDTWRRDDPAAAFYKGKDWLDQAMHELENGGTPRGNPNEEDAFRFRYVFTTQGNRTYTVELIDYSGELIEADLSDSELVKRLRGHMKNMDGILVLAEAPPKGQPAGELTKELHKLRRAFAQLRGEKQEGPALDVPVTLLVNKWDRQTDARSFAPANAQLEVQEFINAHPQPPHRALADALRGAVTEGNFKIFPVSAFGLAEAQGGKERPTQVNPLPSFGLEDGFVWACERRDAIDLDRTEELAGTRAWWKAWQLAGGRAGADLGRNLPDLKRRFPRGTPQAARTRKAAWTAAVATMGQACFALALFMAAVLAAEWYVDDWGHRSVMATLNNPQEADAARLEQSESWLEEYYRAPWFRHTVFGMLKLTRARAWETLEELRGGQMDRYWAAVQEKGADPVERLGPARKMLERFPNCERRAELEAMVTEGEQETAKREGARRFALIDKTADLASKEVMAIAYLRDFPKGADAGACQKIAGEARIARERRKNDDALQGQRAALDSLVKGGSEDPARLVEIRERLEEPQFFNDLATPEQHKAREELVKAVSVQAATVAQALLDKENTKNEGYLKNQEDRLANAASVEDAQSVQLTVRRGMPSPKAATKALLARYNALERASQARLDVLVAKRKWDTFVSAYNADIVGGRLRSAAQAASEFEPETDELDALRKKFNEDALSWLTRSAAARIRASQWTQAREELTAFRSDRYVKRLVGRAHLAKVEDLELDVSRAEDRSRWAKAAADPTSTNLDDYLRLAPLKRMKAQAEAYKKYLADMDGQLDLTVEVKAVWNLTSFADYNMTVKVWANTQFVVSKEVKATKFGTPSLGTVKLQKFRLSDSLSFSSSIRCTHNTPIASDRERGTGRMECRVREMVKSGKRFKADGDGTELELTIAESELPKKPELPAWRD